MTDNPMPQDVRELVELARNEANDIREGHPCADAGLLDQLAQALTDAYAEIGRKGELLRRWLAAADSNHWRGTTHLSLSAHPLADDTRAALKEGNNHV